MFTVKWENTADYKFKRLWHNKVKINSGPTVFHIYLISSSYKTITSVLFFNTRFMCLRNFRRSILFINTITVRGKQYGKLNQLSLNMDLLNLFWLLISMYHLHLQILASSYVTSISRALRWKCNHTL